MSAYQLNIDGKQRQHIGFLASLNDFSYSDGGGFSPIGVVDNPQISLYCLDDIARRAIFVELPAGIDLTQVPFVYRTQSEQARRLIAIPYETFTELANGLPEIQLPIFVHITGRSGSTLLSHVFNASRQVASLSEPDVATQLVNLQADGKPEPELRSLARSTVRFLFKSHRGKDVQAHAIKFRNQGLRVMDLLQSTFPQAKNLFLYRDAVGFVTSFHRIIRKSGAPEHLSFKEWQGQFEQFLAADLSHLSQYLAANQSEISLVEQLTLWWVAVLEWYLDQFDRGNPVLAVRFTDLVGAKGETLKQIFSYCGLSLNRVQQGLRAFEEDAQAGTPLAREDPREGNRQLLSEAQTDSVKAILERHPVLNRSDFTVPGTLRISPDR